MANVHLTWAANSAEELVTSYKVWEFLNEDWNNPVLVGETSGTSFDMPDHLSGIYSWAVSAVNLAGESIRSYPLNGPAVPTQPTGLTLSIS